MLTHSSDPRSDSPGEDSPALRALPEIAPLAKVSRETLEYHLFRLQAAVGPVQAENLLTFALPTALVTMAKRGVNEAELAFVVRLAEVAQDGAPQLLEEGLPAALKALRVRGRVDPGQMTAIEELLSCASSRRLEILRYALPGIAAALEHPLSAEEIGFLSKSIRSGVERAQGNSFYVFSHGLARLRAASALPLSAAEAARAIPLLARIAHNADGNSKHLIDADLPALLQGLGGPASFGEIEVMLGDLAKIADASGRNVFNAVQALRGYGDRHGFVLTPPKLRLCAAMVGACPGDARALFDYALEAGAAVLQMKPGSAEFLDKAEAVVSASRKNAVLTLTHGVRFLGEAACFDPHTRDIRGSVEGDDRTVQRVRFLARGLRGLSRVIEHPGALDDLAVLPEHDVERMLTEPRKLFSARRQAVAAVPDASNAFVRLAAFEMIFHPDQGYHQPRESFADRLLAIREFPPALAVRGSFEISVPAAERGAVSVRAGRELSPELFEALREVFTINKRSDRVATIYQLAGKAVPQFSSESPQEVAVLRELTELAKLAAAERAAAGGQDALTPNETKLHQCLRTLRCLLPTFTGYSLRVPEELDGPQTAFSFYSSIREFFSGHLLEYLERLGIKLSPQLYTKFVGHLLQPVEGELGKLAVGGQTTRVRVAMTGTKSFFDNFYDGIGENCAAHYGLELERPDFQPIRLVNRSDFTHVGVVYALKGVVGGMPALVLAGVEIRKRYAYGASSSTQLLTRLLDQLDRVAKVNGLDGGVWMNVGDRPKERVSQEVWGGAVPDEQWTDDGRISQYDLIRSGLAKEALRQSYLPKDLSPDECIAFPRGFSRPIRRVVRLR